jgi:cold-inducible RNA-binding protein
MSKRLHVGNLGFSADSTELKELFSPHGSVQSAEVVADRSSGRSNGFGFVEMATEQQAQDAIAALDGREHGGRNLSVKEAEPKPLP